MASIRKVAREAGVSIATVSRVLNGNQSVAEDLRERVLKAADTCEYLPNTGKQAPRIALAYTSEFMLNSPYDAACFDGMSRAMCRSSYDLVLISIERDRQPGESLRQLFNRKGVGGAVLRSTVDDRPLLAEFEGQGLPFVILGDHFETESLKFAYADSRTASREAVEHLVALGHERIAFVTCNRDDGDHTDRLTAYREVLTNAGLSYEGMEHHVPPFRMDGAPLARRLLGRPDRPTAMFVADPLVAVGIVHEAHRLGARLGDDLSVIGVDDSDTRNTVFPRLSAVCQDSTLVGEAAFETVREMIEEGPEAQSAVRIEDAWFEIHDTTGPAPVETRVFLHTTATRARSNEVKPTSVA